MENVVRNRESDQKFPFDRSFYEVKARKLKENFRFSIISELCV